MIIGEPPRTQADLNFHAFGIPIRIHPMFWVLTLLLGMRYPKPEVLLAWLLAVLISILIHELGHAMAFRYYGVASYIVLYSFGGLAIPIGALILLGDGSFADGVTKLYQDKPETLTPIGTSESSVPWDTLITGILLINIFLD